jgi:hypothetical protein
MVKIQEINNYKVNKIKDYKWIIKVPNKCNTNNSFKLTSINKTWNYLIILARIKITLDNKFKLLHNYKEYNLQINFIKIFKIILIFRTRKNF